MSDFQPVRIALLGAGHLGKIHLKCLLAQPQFFEVVGFHDAHAATAERVQAETGLPHFADVDELLASCEAVDIVTPTTNHHASALRAIAAGKHIFLEKPLAASLAEAEEICAAAALKGITAQVGHVERFNPALLSVQEILPLQQLQPRFMEIHRLANFSPRGTDVSVVEDLMIHDLDILLHLVRSDVERVDATGVSLMSALPDIVNARVTFASGAVANITASRISMKPMRKFRLFSPDTYVSMDFLQKNAELIRLHEQESELTQTAIDTAKGRRYLQFAHCESAPVNAIEMELRRFAEAIRQKGTVPVPLTDGLQALRLAHLILERIV